MKPSGGTPTPPPAAPWDLTHRAAPCPVGRCLPGHLDGAAALLDDAAGTLSVCDGPRVSNQLEIGFKLEFRPLSILCDGA